MPSPKKPKKVKTKAKIKQWLKDKGHSISKTDALKMDTDADIRKALFELHGLLP